MYGITIDCRKSSKFFFFFFLLKENRIAEKRFKRDAKARQRKSEKLNVQQSQMYRNQGNLVVVT